MRAFNCTYLWGIDMKYRMGLYATGTIFYKAVVDALMGTFSIDSRTLLEMMLTCVVFAVLETAIFPAGKTWETPDMRRRTLLWAVLANAVFVGAALGLGWFRGVPVWGAALILTVFELGLTAIWYGIRLENRRDTERLNQRLMEFQKEE